MKGWAKYKSNELCVHVLVSIHMDGDQKVHMRVCIKSLVYTFIASEGTYTIYDRLQESREQRGDKKKIFLIIK